MKNLSSGTYLLSVSFFCICAVISNAERNVTVHEKGMVKIYWDLDGMKQNDPELIQIIKNEILVPPNSKELKLISMSAKRLMGQFDQVRVAEKILKIKENKKKGFFFEAGAGDGEWLSNSLYFELVYGWNGLLVEPNPELLAKLYTKNRKAWILPHCLSTKKEVEIVQFDAASVNGGIMKEGKIKPSMLGAEEGAKEYGRTITVQCFPLYSVLAALEFPHIDYFSLDIEGAEFAVLDTLPWEEIEMTMLGIEMNHAGDIFDGDKNDIHDLMWKHGYKYADTAVIDDFFYKKENNRFLKKKKKNCPKE